MSASLIKRYVYKSGLLRDMVALYYQVREDWHVNDASWFTPGFHAMTVYRFGAWQKNLPRVLRMPLSLLYGALFICIRNFYGIELPHTATVGRRLRISHQHGIVIHPHAEIGDDCTIRHNVTIGGALGHTGAPKLGHRVDVGVGAVIIGAVTIGDGAHIGPNAVVTMNVPPGATAFATPCRVIQAPQFKKVAAAPDAG